MRSPVRAACPERVFRCIHVVAHSRTSLPSQGNTSQEMDRPHLPIRSPICRCLGFFHFLAFTNSAPLNICRCYGPKFMRWNPNPRQDAIRRWGRRSVIRSQGWSPQVWDQYVPSLCSLSGEDTRRQLPAGKEGPLPQLLSPWSWTPRVSSVINILH